MTPDEILSYCQLELKDVVLVKSWGEQGIFYNPNNFLKRGVYVLTIKEKDGKNDKASRLYRENIYRISIGLRKETFIKYFGPLPKRPSAGETVKMDYNFSDLDRIMPHPIYAWMGWVCILNPSVKSFGLFKIMIEESYNLAKDKFNKRKGELT